ncbi:MAG: hypothetical protein GWP66_10070 [Gammaproteobacteria bacterium]|jgi:hypothetical protein|nr:hypothetical protein [Gammaproteobacteria bacterium]
MARTDSGTSSKGSAWVGIVALLWAVTGCAAMTPGTQDEPADADLVTCTDPRPQMCTMQYDPVCGRIGVGDAAEWKTYASGCSACGDPQVSAYRPGGECK